MRTFGRLAIAAAASLALVVAPAGVASAQVVAATPSDDGDSTSITLTDPQRTAVLVARSAYLVTASGIRTTYRDAVEGILGAARASTAPAQLTYEIAKDAYVFTRVTGGDSTATRTALETARAAYKAALQSARAVAQPKLDAAKSTARTALENATTTYRTAVLTAVPNAPQALLVPPGRGKSWISHGFEKDFGRGWGSMGHH